MVVTGKTQKVNSEESSSDRRPASNPQSREDQLISRAVDLAEQQLRNGTASSQVITHYLKLASPSERKRTEILEKQALLIDAKIEALKSSARMDELYKSAMEAMRSYSGQGSVEVLDD